ncbi:MAG: Mth938-like domain-containing protein [Gallionellaceae bacterium]|nr:Mth938-like domain-containing protein [Gallionellaceae bacterium]
MKLHLANPAGVNLVTAYGDGFVEVNRERYGHSLILLPDQSVDWPVAALADLNRAALAALVELRPALVILGTGRRHRFPHPDLYRDLIVTGIGLEHMDTGAACRTYNILATEGRAVAAALIVE